MDKVTKTQEIKGNSSSSYFDVVVKRRLIDKVLNLHCILTLENFMGYW